MEEVRVLTFHIVKMGYPSFVTLILAVAGAWPKALARCTNTGVYHFFCFVCV